MANCFCGCGRKVGTFEVQTKSANKVGRSVVDAREQMEHDVLPPLERRFRNPQPDHDSVAAALAMADDLVAAGRQHEQTCRAVVHREEAFAAVAWPEIRAWVRKAQGMAGMFRLSPEEQQRIIDRG